MTIDRQSTTTDQLKSEFFQSTVNTPQTQTNTTVKTASVPITPPAATQAYERAPGQDQLVSESDAAVKSFKKPALGASSQPQENSLNSRLEGLQKKVESEKDSIADLQA